MMTLPSSPVFSLRVMRHVLVALALMLAPVIGHAAEWDIDQLMRGLAQIRSDHASFVEKKFIAMLDKPVESSGELFYTAPDHLEKRTIKPKPESMILDHGTLAGDRKALERNYRLSLDGTVEHWTLQLLPVDEKMQAVVKRIRIAGVRDAVRSIEITQADGDSSLMLIEKLATP